MTTSVSRPTRLALSVGCPAGIGPEVAVIAAAAAPPEVSSGLVGDEATHRRAAALRGVDDSGWPSLNGLERDRPPVVIWSHPGRGAVTAPPEYGQPRPQDGAAQLGAVDEALRLVTADQCDAIVTGPVSKSVIASSGAPGAEAFRGHTEHIARQLEAAEPTMTFVEPEGLSVALVTTHLPLRDVPDAITAEGVAATTFWLTDMLSRLHGRPPRVVVAALNPHAGEGGLLGHEEVRVIGPGLEAGRERIAQAGLEVARLDGPTGAETAFRLAQGGQYDGVVAMYHDQATIPSKLLGFGEAVNVTLGLPVVRTSVDHGTAYDVAGSGTASADGMAAAVSLAGRLVASKR